MISSLRTTRTAAIAAAFAVVCSLAGCKNADPVGEASSTTAASEHGSHLAPPQVRVSQVKRSGPGPEVGDKWTADVALNVCGQYMEPPAGEAVRGVRANADGTVEIAPTSEDEAGHNANLAAYIESIGAELATGSLKLPADLKPPEIQVREDKVAVAGATFVDGETCGDVTGKVEVWVYSPEAVKTGDGLVVVAENPQDIPFFADGMALVVTFTPESSLPTLPPSAALRSSVGSGN